MPKLRPSQPYRLAFLDLSERVRPGVNILKIIYNKPLKGFTFVLRIYEIPAVERILLTRTMDFAIEETLLKVYLTRPP
jgi:hypothetical protein